MTLILAVGTKNPAKIAAVQSAANIWFQNEDIEIVPCEISSGVADQPMSDEETLRGSVNRATVAIQTQAQATLGIGLEAGVSHIGNAWFVTGWVTVVDQKGRSYSASTARLPLLPTHVELIVHKGLELGEADDTLFGLSNSKQQNGYTGLLTRDLITRSTIFHDALIAAFGRLEFAHD